jgi:hypothetical protein
MKCKEMGCNGDVDMTKSVIELKTGPFSSSRTYACNVCGRLHFYYGYLVQRRDECCVFFIDGKLVHKNQDSKIIDY